MSPTSPAPSPRTTQSNPPRTSGKVVLGALAAVGALVIAIAVAALEYDRAHSGPPAPLPSATGSR